ncbi:MAG: hypothetical protein MJK04_37750 [Psychrosphaera sp.]|nr:hypothetical protein [Psychrosphaera sp.]
MSLIVSENESAFLYKRVENILQGLARDDALNITTHEASSLTDQQFLEHLLSIHTHHHFRDQKMIKRLEQKRAGQQKFMAFLGRFGGCEKQTSFARLSGISRQNIHNRIKKGTLIAVNEGGVPIVPMFQLDEQTTDEVFGLAQGNLVLDSAKLSGAMKCTFWLNDHGRLDDVSPRGYLVKHTGDEDALSKVLAVAHKAGRQGY